jgi:hypothetical protein
VELAACGVSAHATGANWAVRGTFIYRVHPLHVFYLPTRQTHEAYRRDRVGSEGVPWPSQVELAAGGVPADAAGAEWAVIPSRRR